MVNFELRAVHLLIFLVLKTSPTSSFELEISNNNLLASLFKQVLSPFLQSYAKEDTLVYKAKQEEEEKENVVEAIDDKVSDLSASLQDNIVTEDDKLTLDGNEETTIVEIPHFRTDKSNAFKEDIDKFKALRQKINKRLEKERISNRTRALITRTLDDMIAQMFNHECKWKEGDLRLDRHSGMNLKPIHNQSGVNSMIHAWNQHWKQIKKKHLKSRSSNIDEISSLIRKFEKLIVVMTNDVQEMAKNFKVVCHFMNMYDNLEKAKAGLYKSNIARTKTDVLEQIKIDDNVPCTNFKVCSEELKHFFNTFYNELKNTIVTAVRNYADMFIRDVSDDGYHEKERVVKLINESVSAVEADFANSFINQVKTFQLDESGNAFVNMRNIYKFIIRNIDMCKTNVFDAMTPSLSSVNEKLLLNIRKDIEVNLGTDLEVLEKKVSGQVCSIFENCNGMYFDARKGAYVVGDKNSVYVKVELDLANGAFNISDDKKPSYENVRMLLTRSPKINVTRTVPIVEALQVAGETRKSVNSTDTAIDDDNGENITDTTLHENNEKSLRRIDLKDGFLSKKNANTTEIKPKS